MISIKGFVSNAQLTSNIRDVINDVGELSVWSSTFSKDRGIYYQNSVDERPIYVFPDENSIVIEKEQDRILIHVQYSSPDGKEIALAISPSFGVSTSNGLAPVIKHIGSLNKERTVYQATFTLTKKKEADTYNFLLNYPRLGEYVADLQIKAIWGTDGLAKSAEVKVIKDTGVYKEWQAVKEKEQEAGKVQNSNTNVEESSDAVRLVTFSTKQDNRNIQLKVSQVRHIIKIAKWVYDKSINKGTEIYAHELLQDLITQFASEADNFKAGDIVNDGNVWLPAWLMWKMKNQEEETNIRIWFSDDSFRRTYDEYEISIVTPLTELDDFFKVSQAVSNLLDSRTLVQRTEDIQNAKDNKPETYIRTEMFHYVDPLNPNNKIPTYWDILIYGEAGANIDSIKDALIEHILANSKHTREEWTRIFPDIFRRTEFIFVPFWFKYAIPNRITEKGIYSPIVTIADVVPELRKYFDKAIPDSHLTNYAQMLNHPYKSLAIAVCSGNENRDNLFKLDTVFSDYIAQPSTSQDFNRQLDATRQWAEKFANMLLTAEEMTPYSDIPRGYTRLLRDGKLFIVLNFNNIHYLVAAKYNYESKK